MRDPVSQGPIETHALYGAATPNVGSAWALPRAHPLWAPMDFECKELTEKHQSREERLARFEPPAERDGSSLPKKSLTEKRAGPLRRKNRGAKATLWHQTSSRAKTGLLFWKERQRHGYHIDYAQMRRLMTLSRASKQHQKCDGILRAFCAAP